eukprot:COSAG01_NODE_73124_length_251_cov_0.671053_1_plen_30_part_01
MHEQMGPPLAPPQHHHLRSHQIEAGTHTAS